MRVSLTNGVDRRAFISMIRVSTPSSTNERIGRAFTATAGASCEAQVCATGDWFNATSTARRSLRIYNGVYRIVVGYSCIRMKQDIGTCVVGA